MTKFLSINFLWLFLSGLTLPALATEIELEGIQLTMPDNGSGFDNAVLATDITLSDEEFLEWPFYVISDNDDVTVSASFNGNALVLLNDDPLYTGLVDSLLIFVGDYKGQTGELRIELSSTGGEQSQLLLIQDATELFNVPLPIWAMLTLCFVFLAVNNLYRSRKAGTS